jgi:hypothetical protein
MLTSEDNGFFWSPGFRSPSFWRSVTVCFFKMWRRWFEGLGQCECVLGGVGGCPV